MFVVHVQNFGFSELFIALVCNYFEASIFLDDSLKVMRAVKVPRKGLACKILVLLFM